VEASVVGGDVRPGQNSTRPGCSIPDEAVEASVGDVQPQLMVLYNIPGYYTIQCHTVFDTVDMKDTHVTDQLKQAQQPRVFHSALIYELQMASHRVAEEWGGGVVQLSSVMALSCVQFSQSAQQHILFNCCFIISFWL